MSKTKNIVGITEEGSNNNLIFMEKFLEKTTNKARNNEKNIILRFLEFYKGDLYEIQTSDIRDYFNNLNNNMDISLSSKKQYLRVIRRFLKSVMKNRRIEKINVDMSQNYTQSEMLKFILAFMNQQQIILQKQNILEYLRNHKNFQFRSEQFHKQPKRNTSFIIPKKHLKNFLLYFMRHDYKKYILFRILAETGMRKGGVQALNIERTIDKIDGKLMSCDPIPIEEDIKQRKLFTREKNNYNFYPISKSLKELLLNFLKNNIQEEIIDNEGKPFFVSSHHNRMGDTSFYYNIKKAKKALKITAPITPHTFRKTLNKYRANMGCPRDTRKILVNHAINDINEDIYTPKTWKEIIQFYDKYNPYQNLNF